jgi:hypothetical protein
MRNTLLLAVLGLLCRTVLFSQPCLPGNTSFTLQVQIDSFQVNYPGCTEIQGSLTIKGSDISNLLGLNVITHVGGLLLIEVNPSLGSLEGLNNLISVGEMLRIRGNKSLTSFSGLESLISVGSNLEIESNDGLLDLAGIGSLESIGGDLVILENEALASLDGLEGLSSISQTLSVIDNPALIHLDGLENLVSVHGIQLWFNGMLSDINGLANIDPEGLNFINVDFNPVLSECDIESFCAFIAGPGSVQIMENGTGCKNKDEVEEACDASGVDIPALPEVLSVQPNPVSTVLFLDLRQGLQLNGVSIFNTAGQKLLGIEGGSTRIDVASLPAGLYILEAEFEGHDMGEARILFMKK